MQALIHLESIQQPPKRIEYLDSLVEKFIVPSPDNLNITSVSEREELSSIYLEVLICHFCFIIFMVQSSRLLNCWAELIMQFASICVTHVYRLHVNLIYNLANPNLIIRPNVLLSALGHCCFMFNII